MNSGWDDENFGEEFLKFDEVTAEDRKSVV